MISKFKLCLVTECLPDRKAGLLPLCGTAIFVRVAGDESKERRIRILAVENLCHWNRPCATMHLALIRSSFFLAFLEKYGPEDGKSLAYVKKFVCLSVSEFTNFSKLAIFQVFWKIWPRLFGYFCGDDKSNNRAFLYSFSLLDSIQIQ